MILADPGAAKRFKDATLIWILADWLSGCLVTMHSQKTFMANPLHVAECPNSMVTNTNSVSPVLVRSWTKVSLCPK